jgi:hypothetical protein
MEVYLYILRMNEGWGHFGSLKWHRTASHMACHAIRYSCIMTCGRIHWHANRVVSHRVGLKTAAEAHQLGIVAKIACYVVFADPGGHHAGGPCMRDGLCTT